MSCRTAIRKAKLEFAPAFSGLSRPPASSVAVLPAPSRLQIPTSGEDFAAVSRAVLASPAATPPVIPTTALVHVCKIGEGAFGEVFKAEWNGSVVAVKGNGIDCADESAILRERQMLEVLFRNPHPNVLAVYGVCLASESREGFGALTGMRLVTGYCAGGDLEGFLKKSLVMTVSSRRLHCPYFQ